MHSWLTNFSQSHLIPQEGLRTMARKQNVSRAYLRIISAFLVHFSSTFGTTKSLNSRTNHQNNMDNANEHVSFQEGHKKYRKMSSS